MPVGLHPVLPWPKARPLLRACSSAWRSELLPSAQPKWLWTAKEISPAEKLLALPIPLPRPHLHTGMGEEHYSASSPDSPTIPVHRTKHSALPHHPHPTRETSQRLLLATTPIFTETWLWCFWHIISSFSPPNPNSYMSEMLHYQPMQK